MADLCIKGVAKAFGSQRVLHDNDLRVRDGELVALLGPSGCGKTTLLRLIAGFERVDAGEIRLGDTILSSHGFHLPPEKRRIGYVPQEGALFPHMTVAANILYGLPRRDRRIETIAALAEMTDLTDLLDRRPHELSGGQQQRVALARALAPGPKLVVLDEPFNALDIDLRRNVLEYVVATLRAAGASALIVTHDPQEAFASADRIAVMAAGRIAQVGDPIDVYREPAELGLASITGPALLLDGTVRGGRAETALGTIRLARSADFVGRATILLRPEQIVAKPAGEELGFAIQARSFRGDHWILTILLDGREVQLRAEASSTFGVSERIHIAVAGFGVAYICDPGNRPHAVPAARSFTDSIRAHRQ
jgi:iron(III) transport system ATP-binding protein